MLIRNTIATMFSQQANLCAENIALEHRLSKLSYQHLEEKSNQLARYLIARGVKRETLVPICIHRSFDMVIGILGIIKAGAAYVPIDPNYPADRINYILGETRSDIILSHRQINHKFPGQVILLDEEWPVILTEESTRLEIEITPEQLVYTIFTSGSTGRPKGVEIEHQSLATYIHTQTKFLGLTSDEKILQFSNFCFDASVEQIFLALLSGACLVLTDEAILMDPERFADFVKQREVTHLHATPGFLDNLLPGAYPHLKRIIAAGDTCSIDLAARWNQIDFYNKYGPTEATISVLEYKCPPTNLGDKTLPIGKALATAQVYILNETMQIVADNQIGEIYIGGPQLARGYLNQPDLTAQLFLQSPFHEGERLYKTGDLARWLPDGNVEFCGRIDDQVKIRGYRIELGEIENTLRSFALINQAVVIAERDHHHQNYLIAYVVADSFDKAQAEAYLASRLPAYMVPQVWVVLDQLPLTPNGKVDKKALVVPDASEGLTTVYLAPRHATEKKISEIWKALLRVNRVGINDSFFELGGNSLRAQKMVNLLKDQQLVLPIAKLYQSPTVAGISAFLDGRSQQSTLRKKSSGPKQSAVAIVGMAGRFPGADSINEFWSNLTQGKESISFFKDEELDLSIPEALKSNPNYIKARGIIKEPAAFDPAFFGINPRLAALMDPQQRIFLEVSWEALEHSGIIPQKYSGSIGVFAGCRFNTYYSQNVASNHALIEQAGAFQVGTVSDKDYIATRTAFALDLKGPAVNIQSACSTSLVAVIQAVESIRNGHCDVALAGGSSMLVPVRSGHLYEEGAMLSADGHCRPFDAAAEGTVFSDGAGVVVLKNLEQAERDGDTIYALIKGVGLSNDGGQKASFTAPSAEGQAQAIHMAMEDAEVKPAEISYIETHGTATPLGDPIEIEGLNLAFGEQEKKQYCAIGSVKSNLGHLTGASGVVGLIKTALALYYKKLPATINYTRANPHIDFQNSPFYVNTSLEEWTTANRVAGVSSFGVGGTNAHVILTEAEEHETISGSGRPVQLLTWSAKSALSLDLYVSKLNDYLLEGTADLNDVAYTLRSSRDDFNHRRFALSTGTKTNGVSPDLNSGRQNSNHLREKLQDLVFMFPGQGAQYLNMGIDLYRSEKVFREAMEECATLLQIELNENILEVIYPAEITASATEKLQNTRYSQPALFCMGYALGKLWMSWGIFPTALIGHSIGEFVAAYFAGVFSLKDAIKLIALRGKMMSELPGGSMLSIRSAVKNVEAYFSDDISLAAVNSDNLCVVAGEDDIISALSETLTSDGILNRLLSTSHAFHSHMMDPVVGPFQEVVNTISLHKPLLPILSTVTGEWMTSEQAMDPTYWAKHLRSTVVFGKAAQKLIDEGFKAYLELGPGSATATLTRQQSAGKALLVVSALEKEETSASAYYPILKALGQLWIHGIEINWDSFYKDEHRRKLNDLPTYAFDHKDYWVNPISVDAITSHTANHILPTTNTVLPMRKPALITLVKEILEDASGIEMTDVTPDMTFIEMGLDSLLLTQVALTLKKQFELPITFRQLNDELETLDLLTDYIDGQLPAESFAQVTVSISPPPPAPVNYIQQPQQSGNAIDLISQQLQLLARQLALLQVGGSPQEVASFATPTSSVQAVQPQRPAQIIPPAATTQPSGNPDLSPEEELEIKKPFGAAARIEKQSAALNAVQQRYLADLTERYNAKTKASKDYTQQHRAHMADPRVVTGFKPATKELVYSIVINKSKGSKLWDIDNNEYIDALNGFGSNMLGYQPDLIKEALIDQIEKGYEIGPQHELAGEVSELICEFTGFDRTALCNTGSEAVLGAMRIARTVTGRSLIVAFTGSYHGIADEVIVRGSKKLKTYPAAAGILPDVVQNMLILDYGTNETLRIIEERASEIAAVLVEPVQSRRADFQPIAFLKKVREITEQAEAVLIFDEVISGFRFHLGGVQAMFGIRADIGTYGKVAGGGISIGIIAGKKKYMDALDGGFWQYGDDSIPEVGVTYFAGTFVRHPLALATAKASLTYLKAMGPQLQEGLNANGTYIANAINGLCRRLNVPMHIAQFGSLWRIKFIEEYPYSELFFTLMRYKGIHILEGFACFLTTAHSSADIAQIIRCFEESLVELKEVGLIPEYYHVSPEKEADETTLLNLMPVPNAKLGKDTSGNPAWFIKDENNPGKYLQVINTD